MESEVIMAGFYSFIPLLREAVNSLGFEKILEWGTGKSTTEMDIEGVEVIHTYEHQQKWYDRYKNAFSPRVKCHLLTLEEGYSEAGGVFPPEYFDFAFVDGTDRVNCMITATRLVKHGGYVMLHDVERARYKPGIALFNVMKVGQGTLLMCNNK
jgi:hypothetical protein